MTAPSTRRYHEDDDERLDPGAFLIGRQHNLADWHFRKDNAAFEKLVATLRAVKWNREHLSRRRAHSLKWAKDNAATLLAQAKSRRARRALQRAAAVITCQGCAAEFCRVPPKGKGRGKTPTWCTPACLQRAHYAADKVKFIARAERQRQGRIDAGLCVFCPVDDVQPADPRRRACRDCADVMAAKQRARRAVAA